MRQASHKCEKIDTERKSEGDILLLLVLLCILESVMPKKITTMIVIKNTAQYERRENSSELLIHKTNINNN